MGNKSDNNKLERSFSAVVYLLISVLLIMVSQNYSQSDYQGLIQFLFLIITIVLIVILVVFNYSKMYFSITTSEVKESSNELFHVLFLLIMGFFALFAVYWFSQVSYKEMIYFQFIFEWSDEGFAVSLHKFIQYLLFLLGAASLGTSFAELFRTSLSMIMSEEYGKYNHLERSPFIIKLIGNSSNHQSWREDKKYFDDELKQQLVECMAFLKDVTQLDTGGNHWGIDVAWKAVSSELYTRSTKKYGWLEDPNFEIDFQNYCKNQSVYKQFMDKIIEDEMNELARDDSKGSITYRRLCNLLSLFDCENLIQSNEISPTFDRENFKKKCKQMLFVLRSLKSERDSLHSRRRIISSILRHIDSNNFEGQVKLISDAIDEYANEGVLEAFQSQLAEKIRFHLNEVGDYSLPDVGVNPNEQTPYVKRLEDIVEGLSDI
jgi:hypothetical protein